MPGNARFDGGLCTYDGRKDVHNLGAGDSYYLAKLVKGTGAQDRAFAGVLHEAALVQMFDFTDKGRSVAPIPRLITAQTDTSETGRTHIYRMPGCNQHNVRTTGWGAATRALVARASEAIGQPLNHCVVTLYRGEDDSLAFHQDKLVDLAPDSAIVSLSLGAARPILFETLDGEKKFSLRLRPGSLLVIGPRTNRQWRHAVPKLRAGCGPRISLSARTIASTVDGRGVIHGRGAEHQTPNYPFSASHDDESRYPPEVRAAIASHEAQAESQLALLRARHLT